MGRGQTGHRQGGSPHPRRLSQREGYRRTLSLLQSQRADRVAGSQGSGTQTETSDVRSQEVQAFISLGEEAKTYLERLSATHEPLKKTLQKLLLLKDEYGAFALIEAIKRAALHNAYGAHYIENILYREMTPKTSHPPSGSNRKTSSYPPR